MKKRCVILTLILACVILILPACKEKETPIAEKKIYATMKIIGKGEIVFELSPDKSPKAVEQFMKLAKDGYYNNLLFFHVSKEGVTQSGCAFNDGSGYANKAVKSTIDPEYKTSRGDLVMNAHFENDPTAVSSQFIILGIDLQVDTDVIIGQHAVTHDEVVIRSHDQQAVAGI